MIGKTNRNLEVEQTQELKYSVNERIEFAEACHLLGQLDEACIHFHEAEKSLKGRTNPQFYLKHGNYQRDIKETDNAIKSYKAGVECVGSVFAFKDAFRNLTELLLHQCREKRRPEHLVREIAGVFDSGFNEYNRGSSIQNPVRYCCRGFRQEMLAVCKTLIAQRKYDTVRVACPELLRSFENYLQHCRRSGKRNVAVIEMELQTVREMWEALQDIDRHQVTEAEECVIDSKDENHHQLKRYDIDISSILCGLNTNK